MTGEEGEDERKERAEPMLDARCSMLPFIDLDGLSRPTRAVENGGILPTCALSSTTETTTLYCSTFSPRFTN